MCGLVGIFGNITDTHRKMFKWLLYLDVFRGPHSTGVAFIKKDGSTQVVKELGMPHKLWEAHPDLFDNDGNPILEDIIGIIGHNRFATKGEVVVENAHPFTFDTITGAHNGTLSDFALKNLKEHDKWPVDSQVIFRNIFLDDIATVWSSTYGAMALSWWDAEEHTLNLCRNDQRPLHYVHYDGCVIWSSEKWVINFVKDVCNVRMMQEPRVVEINTLYSFYQTKNQFMVTEDRSKLVPFAFQKREEKGRKAGFQTFSTVAIRLKEFVPNDHHKYSCGYFVGDNLSSGEEIVINLFAENREKSEELKNKVMADSEEGLSTYTCGTNALYSSNGTKMTSMGALRLVKPEETKQHDIFKKDKLGNKVSVNQFTELAKGGCSCCYSPILPSDFKNVKDYIVFDFEDVILCPVCSEDEQSVNAIKQLNSVFSYSYLEG